MAFNNFPYADMQDLNIDWLLKKMKETDALSNRAMETAQSAEDIANQLKEFVNNYFDNLDVQNEINNKIDAMVASGEFDTIVARVTPDAVAAWMNENLTPSTETVIDSSLTVSGAAADAKVTGDRIRNLEAEIDGMEYRENLVNMSWTKGRYNALDIPIGSPNTSNTTFCTLTSIPYDSVYALEIKEGYKASFPSFAEGVVCSGATEFLTGTVTIEQIRANVNRPGTDFAIQIRTLNEDPIPAATTPDFVVKLTPITIEKDNLAEDVQKMIYNQYGTTKWCAIGDSITDGRYSYMDGDNPASDTDHEVYYGMIAARMLHFADVIEYGYSSMGWIHAANDATILSDVLDMDFDNPDLITVCLGVNDTAAAIPLGDYNSVSNDGSISGAIKNACEVLGAKYPNAQIVLLTPLNAIQSSTAATQWRRKYTVNGRHSLEEISDLIMYWGDYFGYPVVDMLRNSPVNVRNIESMLLDGLHPTKKAHEMIAHYLAGALPRKD